MRYNTLASIVVIALLSYLVSYIVYFNFVSNYSVNYFSKRTFEAVYDHGVYSYRILSQFLLKSLNDLLDHYSPPGKGIPRSILYLDRNGSRNFYLAFFYLNTFFLILTSMISVLIFDTPPFSRISKPDRSLILFFIPIIINITQFCIVPYDMTGYFFEVLTLFLFLRYFEKNFILCVSLMCILTILSTLNRESAVLTVLLIGILLFGKQGFSDRAVVAFLCLILSFAGTYFCLRYFISTASMAPAHDLAGDYRLYINQLGVLFWVLFFYLSWSMSNTKMNRQMIIAYHLLCIPYIYYIFFKAMPAEVRLYIPLLLGSIFLAKLDEEYFKFPPGQLLKRLFFIRK